jgi:hypothetical protein
MPYGDAQRTWFPETLDVLRVRWRASLSFSEMIALRDELDAIFTGSAPSATFVLP